MRFLRCFARLHRAGHRLQKPAWALLVRRVTELLGEHDRIAVHEVHQRRRAVAALEHETLHVADEAVAVDLRVRDFRFVDLEEAIEHTALAVNDYDPVAFGHVPAPP